MTAPSDDLAAYLTAVEGRHVHVFPRGMLEPDLSLADIPTLVAMVREAIKALTDLESATMGTYLFVRSRDALATLARLAKEATDG